MGVISRIIRRRAISRALLAGALFVLGCEHGEDSSRDHECQEHWRDPDWGVYQMTYWHNEPRMCPVDINGPYQTVYSAGFVMDQGFRDFKSLIINGVNWPDGGPLGLDVVDFVDWGGFFGWAAYAGLEIEAATGMDQCRDLLGIQMAERYPGTSGSLVGGAYFLTYDHGGCPGGPSSGGSGGGGGGGGGASKAPSGLPQSTAP